LVSREKLIRLKEEKRKKEKRKNEENKRIREEARKNK